MIAGASAFDFVNAGSRGAATARAFASLEFGSVLVAAALVAGLMVWAAMWVFHHGSQSTHDPRETVLWSACVLTVLASGLRLFS